MSNTNGKPNRRRQENDGTIIGAASMQSQTNETSLAREDEEDRYAAIFLGDISYSSEEDRYAAVSHKPTYEEGANDCRNRFARSVAEKSGPLVWVAGENQDFCGDWRKGQKQIDNEYASTSIEARSSVSSPGKISLREKLKLRLLKRQQDGFQTDGTLGQTGTYNVGYPSIQQKSSLHVLDSSGALSLALAHSNPPPPPPLPPFPQTSRQKAAEKHSLNYPKLSKEHAQERPREDEDASMLRLTRTVRYGRRGEMPVPAKPGNVIRLHIYDLISNDTIMQLPFGCEFPIGRAFQAMNNGLHAMGTGVYHCGVEVNGVEYAYGANEVAGSTGVFTCVPRLSPGYQYRSTIDFGRRSFSKRSWVSVKISPCQKRVPVSTYREIEHFVNGRDIMKEMALEYKGTDYNLLRKNCCTFAKDACLRLGVKESEIPTWFMNLAHAGAKTQDGMQKTLDALTPRIEQRNEVQMTNLEPSGFEVIPNHGCIAVVEAVENQVTGRPEKKISVRRTLSWTY